MNQTRFTNLVGLETPIQLAGMPGVCTLELAAAVSNAGGLGMISATHLTPEFLSQELDSLRTLTDGMFGVNFLMPFLDLDCVRVAASKSRLVEFFYDAPDPSLVTIAHGEGALVGWQVGSFEEAVQAARAGCNYIVAQGVQSGGHVRGDTRLNELLPEVLRAVDIPVIVAGGIATGKDLAEAINSGADGARIGTRFVASKESGAHPKYIEAIINAGKDSTVLTETFSTGWPHAHHRVLKSCVDQVNNFNGDTVGERKLGEEKKPVPKYSIALPTKDTTGHIDAMALYAGECAGEITKLQSAEEIVKDILEEAESINNNIN